MNDDATAPANGKADAKPWKEQIAPAAISLFAAAAFVLHTWYQKRFPIDGIGAGLLALVALPWLRGFIKSIEIPGVGKMELQEVTRTAQLAKGTAESTQRQIDAFLSATETSAPRAVQLPDSTNYAQLAAQYNHIRASQAGGPQRTRTLDELFNKMVYATEVAKPEQISEWLASDDGGYRLLGYAASYASPDRAPVSRLVDSVADKEDKPFGWYWGLVALRRAIQAQGPNTLVGGDRAELLKLRRRLPDGSDRSAELDRVLALTE